MNGEVQRHGCAALAMQGIRIDTITSQGCQAVSEAVEVKSVAEGNIILEVEPTNPKGFQGQGKINAGDWLRWVARQASMATGRQEGQVLMGVSMSEETSMEKAAGPYLMRHIQEASTGGFALGGMPREIRVGDVLQVHMRDRSTASEELSLALSRYTARSGVDGIKGALLVPCVARGAAFFGTQDHDTRSLRWFLEGTATTADTDANNASDDSLEHNKSPPPPVLPVAGFFGDGEVASIGATTVTHAYTSAIAIFRDEEHAKEESIFQTSKDRQQFTGALDQDVQETLDKMVQKGPTPDFQECDGEKGALPLFMINQGGAFPPEYPGTLSRFHVFEPRYRLMIDRCVERGGHFGLITGGGHGTACEILSHTKHDDGRSHIEVKAHSRFSLGSSWTSPASFGLNLGLPRYFDDDPIREEDRERTEELALEVEKRLREVIPDDMLEPLEEAIGKMPDKDPKALSFWACAVGTRGMGQDWLELFRMTDTRMRLEQVLGRLA